MLLCRETAICTWHSYRSCLFAVLVSYVALTYSWVGICTFGCKFGPVCACFKDLSLGMDRYRCVAFWRSTVQYVDAWKFLTHQRSVKCVFLKRTWWLGWRKPTTLGQGRVVCCATNGEECDILRTNRLFHKQKHGESPHSCFPLVCETTTLLLFSCQYELQQYERTFWHCV